MTVLKFKKRNSTMKNLTEKREKKEKNPGLQIFDKQCIYEISKF